MNLQSDLPGLIESVVSISRLAGREILKFYDSGFDVEMKDDNSPLTTADRAAHHLIQTALEQLTPEIPVWSEESAAIPYAVRRHWKEFWLVDPLDGTKEFIKRNGEFTVNIALIRDHQAVMGIVHVPVTDISYFGSKNTGAWRQQGSTGAKTIRVRQPAAKPAIIVGSRSHANPELVNQLDRLGSHELVSMGSSLKFCRIAEGLADFYPRTGPTCEWDTAAAQAVVEAAGGQVVKTDGSPLLYNRKESYLNPYFFVFGDPKKDWLPPFQDMNQKPA
jgi:3'(2'), 5'-bisphosphate nucleotidase